MNATETLTGKPVTMNGKQIGTVTDAESGYDAIYVTLALTDNTAIRALGGLEFKADL